MASAALAFVEPALSDPAWVETRSTHFRVVSNAGAKTAERIALQFERIRGVFKKQWAWAKVDAPEPVIVIAARDENTMRGLLPAFWETKGATHPAGVFVNQPDRHYMLLRSDADDEDNPFEVLYHEYTHRLIALNFSTLPLWLNEGFAEFYGSTVIHGDDVTQGKPQPGVLMFLQPSALLPLDTLFEIDQTSPHYNEQTRANTFYAQSWALVHYFILGDRGTHTDELNEFVARLRRGVPEREARAALGEPKLLERTLATYVVQRAFFYRKYKDFLELTDRVTRSRTLAGSESAALRGDFLARCGRPEGRALLEDAIKLDGMRPEPYESLAALSSVQDDAEAARGYVEKAIERRSSNSFTWFLAGVLFAKDGKGSPRAEEALRRSLALNPEFAPAYATLASFLSQVDGKQDEAAQLALRVAELAPANPLLILAAAETLVKVDHMEEARILATRVVDGARTPELKKLAEALLERAASKDRAK